MISFSFLSSTIMIFSNLGHIKTLVHKDFNYVHQSKLNVKRREHSGGNQDSVVILINHVQQMF